MRRCFLHIGTHKTGTTSIQVTLNNCRNNLAQRGYLYPKTGIPPGLAGQHNIAWQFSGDRRFVPELGTSADLLLEIDKSEDDVILSSEDFECAANNLGAFISDLEKHRFKVEIIIYIRDQISYARSLYLEMINHGCDRTFSEFLSEIVNDHAFRWKEWVFTLNYCMLLKQLPSGISVIARPYNRTASVIRDLALILQTSPAELQIDPDLRTNKQGLVCEAVVAFYINRTGRRLDNEERASIMPVIAQTLGAIDMGISVNGRNKLIATFEASNRWMEAHYRMPSLTDIMRETNGAASSAGAQVDLEEVFSTTTLDLIDGLLRTKSLAVNNGISD